MKRFVDCDQVFDVLTRGPFPSGAESDDAVEAHLHACHECRRLAEALQPAVALFQESLASGAGEDLPVYQGRLFVTETSTARVRSLPEMLSMGDFARRSEPIRKESSVWLRTARVLSGTRVVAATALILAFGMLCWGLGSTLQKSLAKPALLTATISPRHQPDERGVALLTALRLPLDCLPRELGRTHLTSATGSPVPTVAHVCCTRCHAESKPSQPEVRSIAKLQDSCSACHEKS